MSNFFKDYFSFTRKERNAVFFLLILVVVIFILPKFFPAKTISIDKNLSDLSRQIEEQRQHEAENHEPGFTRTSYESAKSVPEKEVALFKFDPNTLSAEGWRKLGLREKTIGTIQKYISKGGRFKIPRDIRKIYGIAPSLAEKLMPYVNIETGFKTYETEKFKPSSENIVLFRNNINIEPIDINTADSMAFVRLKGIGPKLASRIINFRNKLGGFYKIDQLAETYGLNDSTFQSIRPFLRFESTLTKKLDLNNADSKELHQHPYFNWNITNAIIQYRQQHGAFKDTKDLLQIGIINQEVFQKLSPYLVVNPIKN